MHERDLAGASYGQIREATFEVAVLPFGATEPHNLHLPYGTQTNMRRLPLVMNLNPSTPLRVVEDLVDSLMNSGLRKIAADDGSVRRFRFEAMRRGWVKTSRAWHLLTSNTGAGNPHHATAEKGRKAIDLLVARLAPFLVELSDAKIDEPFPFEDGETR